MATRIFRWKPTGINITAPFRIEKESLNISDLLASMSRFGPTVTIVVRATRTF